MESGPDCSCREIARHLQKLPTAFPGSDPSHQLGLTCRGDGNDGVPNAAFIETISWSANKPDQTFGDKTAEGPIPELMV